MSKSFNVENVVFCDYAAQEVSGKLVWAGIYLNEVVFFQKPQLWNLHIVMVLTPRRANFKFDARFIKPSGKSLITIDGEHSAPNLGPFPNLNPVILQLPMVNVPFTEVGDYSFEIREGAALSPVYKKTLLVRVGSPTPQLAGDLKASVTFDTD
jgi:hypothetical protein